MSCPSCGQVLDASRLVCPHCGHAPDYRAESRPGPGAPASPWAAPGDWSEAGSDGMDEPTAELPTNGFGDPRQYLAATHQPPVRQYLPVAADGTLWSPAEEQPKKRRLALPILLLALALLVTGGGAAAAGYYLGWFGAGTQPSDVMPAATIAYVQVDLDPSLSQKSQAWAFLRDLPQVRQAVAAGQPDPKRMIWDALSTDASFAPDADYDTDVKPWLGDRVGFGVLGHDDQPVWITAIQVTDEAAAAEKLRSWIGTGSQGYDVTTRDGYAVITARADTDFVFGELAKGPLSGNDTFRSDVAALGETGVLAGWADLAALAKQGASSGGQDTEVQGRVALALRFTTDTLALDGRFFAVGSALNATSGAGTIGQLPQSTGAAMSISGGADAVKGIWSSLPGGFSNPLAGSGLDEADLEALLGRNFTIAAPTTTLAIGTSLPASDVPAVGVRITTDDVVRARSALRKLALADDVAAPVFDDVDGDVLTAATTQDYLTELLQPTAKLSGYAPFAKAVPDHARATAATYVNLTPLVSAGRDFGEYSDFLSSLQSVGSEVVPDDAGGGSWSVRLVRS